jgi:predicted Co/Zn/Cd cation transporter (cation efflux family)
MPALVKRLARELASVQVSDRQAIVMATLSSALFIALTLVWLVLSTRTALLNQQIDALDVQLASLVDEINQTWVEISMVTAEPVMENRARRLGFGPAEKVEYLVSSPGRAEEAQR